MKLRMIKLLAGLLLISVMGGCVPLFMVPVPVFIVSPEQKEGDNERADAARVQTARAGPNKDSDRK